MSWLFHHSYFGPDRRGRRQLRILERRKRAPEENGSRASIQGALRELFERGLKWVDAATYFGPDRRTGVFSHFILERREFDAAGSPPPLHAALRQLRVRVLEADRLETRASLKERLIATAVLADARGHQTVGDQLTHMAEELGSAGDGVALSGALHAKLLAAEAMLDQAASPSRG